MYYRAIIGFKIYIPKIRIKKEMRNKLKKSLAPEKVYGEFLSNKLNRTTATDLFISLIEESNNAEVRMRCIELLEKMGSYSNKLFKILENCLISDENPLVRSRSARVIILSFIKEGMNSLIWAIQHDNSPLLMQTIFDLLENVKGPYLELINIELKKKINNLSLDMGIVPEEARFILDLEVMFTKGKKDFQIDSKMYEYYKSLKNFKNNESWLKIKNKRIEILNFNFFNWKFLRENLENIDSFSKLKHVDLFLTSIKEFRRESNNHFKIPESIGSLTSIRSLNLSGNDIQEIPVSIGKLKTLQNLNLSHNNIRVVPEVIGSLSSLKYLDLRHNDIQEIPEIIANLKCLTKLKLSSNKIHKIPQSLKPFLNSLELFKI